MKFPSGIFLIAALALPLNAQQPFVGKVDVSLVNVDVSVTSRGAPARGLTRDDFEILEDGVPQPITNFYAIEAGAPAAAAQAPAPQPDERFRRRVMVIVDTAHSSRHGRDVALSQLERFIDQHFSSGEYEWSIAVTARRVHLLLPPTMDKAAIHSAFAEVRRLSARGDFMGRNALPALVEHSLEPEDLRQARSVFETRAETWIQNFDTRDSVDAVVQAVRAYTNSPGRKIILLISGGLGFSGEFNMIPFDSRSVPTDSIRRVVDAGAVGTRLRDRLVREANASNVSFYVINPEGLVAPGDLSGAPMTNNSMSFWIATETGGRMLPGNDVALSLQEFDRTSANFYSLAYRPPHVDDGKYHRIAVRLKRPGNYKLQYRSGYVSVPAETQLVRMLASPLAPTLQTSGIPVKVTTGLPRQSGDAVLLPVTVEVPFNALQALPSNSGSAAEAEIYISLFDDRGNHLTTGRFSASADAPAEVLRATEEVRLTDKGPRRIVVAVRDPITDAVGIAEVRHAN